MTDQNTNYSSELQRILNSSLPNQVLKQLTNNQAELSYVEQTITMKNSQINNLHQRLKQQINTINELIRVNDQLSSENNSIKKSFKMLKQQLNDFKGTCISMLQGYLIKQKQSTLKKVNQAIQNYLLNQQTKTIDSKNHNILNQNIRNQKCINDKLVQTQTDSLSQLNKLSIQSQINIKIAPFRMQKHFKSFESQTDQEQIAKRKNQFQINAQQNLEKQQQILKIIQTLEQQICTLRNEKHQISQQLKEIKNQMNKQINNERQKRQVEQKITSFQVQNQNSTLRYCQNQSIFTSLNEDQPTSNSQLNQQEETKIIRMVLQNISTLVQTKFIGQMLEGQKNGLAICQFENNWHFEGNYQNNQKHGLGTLFYKQKKIYYGNWRHNQIEGVGILYYFDNSQVYQVSGKFKNGIIQGYGTIKFKTGYKIKCRFVSGIPQIKQDNCLLSFNRNQSIDQSQICKTNKKSYFRKMVCSQFGNKFQTNCGIALQLY